MTDVGYAMPPTESRDIIVVLPLRTYNPLNGQSGNSRWAAIKRTGERKEQRSITRILVRAKTIDPSTMLPAVVTLTRISAGRMDDDGLAAALKSIRDGIADTHWVWTTGPPR